MVSLSPIPLQIVQSKKGKKWAVSFYAPPEVMTSFEVSAQIVIDGTVCPFKGIFIKQADGRGYCANIGWNFLNPRAKAVKIATMVIID